MYDFFVKLLNMSFAAGVLVLVIVVLRLFLKKAPKKYLCILWALAALRLLCPFSISSSLSAFNLMDQATASDGQIEYFQYNGKTEKPMVEFTVPSLVEDDRSPESMTVGARTSDVYLPAVMKVWLVGVGLMLLHAFISYLRLRKKVAASIPLRDNVMISDDIQSPFILGVFRPTIYIPSGMDEAMLPYVLMHESAHIQRRDHWWKPLGYLLLCVHWFNPVIWLAYILFCRDIELSCDEKVIRNMNTKGKASYSQALLHCSLPRRRVLACPLAFGEVGIKERIKNVRSHRKPGFWIVLAVFAVCIAVAVCFLTNPEAANGQRLTLEAVRHLAERGDALTWEDFEPYAWEEVDSDRYARRYDINNLFEVIVESDAPESEPTEILLRNKDINAWIDVRTGDVVAFTSTPAFGGVDGPTSVTVTQNSIIDADAGFDALFTWYDQGGEAGKAAEAVLLERRNEALKYCMRRFDAGILEGLTLDSTGAEMCMYRFWQSALTSDILESPFEGVQQDWQSWSEHVRYLYERNGYDETLFDETKPCSRCYVEIIMEEDAVTH